MFPWELLKFIADPRWGWVIIPIWLGWQVKAPEWFGRDTLFVQAKSQLREEVQSSNKDIRDELAEIHRELEDLRADIEANDGDTDHLKERLEELLKRLEEQDQGLRILAHALDDESEYTVDAAGFDEYLRDNGIDIVELLVNVDDEEELPDMDEKQPFADKDSGSEESEVQR